MGHQFTSVHCFYSVLKVKSVINDFVPFLIAADWLTCHFLMNSYKKMKTALAVPSVRK